MTFNFKKISIVLIVVVLLIVIFLIVNFININKLTDVKFYEQSISNVDLIAYKYSNSADDFGVKIIASSLDKEDMLSGNWQFEFINPKEMMLFGTMATQTINQSLLFVSDKSQEAKKISNLPGQIISVKADNGGNYLLISGVVDSNKSNTVGVYYGCVIQKNFRDYKTCRIVLGSIIPQTEIVDGARYQSAWVTADNASSTSWLVTKEYGGKNRYFIYNPASDKTEITISPPKIKEPMKNILPTYIKLGWFNIVYNKDTKKINFFLTGWNDIVKLINANSAFLNEKISDNVYIVNISAKTKTKIINKLNGQKISLFTYKSGEISF